MDIKELNFIANSLINGEECIAKNQLPSTKQELEVIISKEAEWHEMDAHISFLPLNRLNSKEEREKGMAIISQVILTGKFTSGPYVDEIEKEIGAIYNGFCIATSSGTDALKIALKALNIGYGDEVIVPLNSFAATENAIFAVGATPVFINIDESHNIKYDEIDKLITNKTKAIIAVCLYGSARNMSETYNIAKKNGLNMIIDAAQCFGLKEIANYADIITLSFNPFKNIGSFGKSGALITRIEALGNYARMYSYHGFLPGKKNIKGIDWGYNSRMDNMQAAILKEKMQLFNINALKRCYLAYRYIKELQPLEEKGKLKLPIEKEKNTWHLFPLFIEEGNKDELIKFAQKNNVEFDVYYPILGHQYVTEFSKRYKSDASFKISEKIHEKTLHIPLHNHMSLEEQNKIIALIYEYFE